MSPTDRDQGREDALAVADQDALDDVLLRLWLLAGRSVRVSIPSRSPHFLTAAEFRALRDVADRQGIRLTVQTEDPLRVQLAGMFGLEADAVGGPPGPRPLPDPPAFESPAAGPRLVPLASDPPAAASNGWSAPPVPPLTLPDLPPSPLDSPSASLESPALSDGAAPFPGPGQLDAEPRFREPGQPFTIRRLDEAPSLEIPTRAPVPPLSPIPDARPAPAPVVAPPARPAAPPSAANGATQLRRSGGPPEDAASPGPGTSAPTGGTGRFDELRAAAERRAGRARQRRGDRRVVAAGAVAGLVLLALGALALFLVLPRATVEVSLQEQTLVAEARFRIVPPGEAAAGESTFPGEPATVEVAYTATIETTGTAALGETPARGTVRLANPGDQPVSIPAGTVAESDTGAGVRFTQEVTVPAAEDGVAGQADARVEMVEPGSAGNLGVGELSGRLDSGVYFSNRMEALTGGADRQTRGVAQADLDALRARFEAELPRLAGAQFAETLAPGLVIATDSLDYGEPEIAFDRAAGEAGDTVTLTATVTVNGLAYRPEVVMAAAEPRLRADLDEQVPEGYELDPAAVTFSEPESLSGNDGDGVAVVVTASGRAVYRFTEADREALVERLEGEDADAAAEILRTHPAIDTFSVDYFPGLPIERMPRRDDRIEIVLRD